MSTFPVQFVFVRRQLSPEVAMSSRASLPQDTGEEDQERSELSASVVTDPSVHSQLHPKTVWDFEKIEKVGGPDVFSRGWQCGWCGLHLKGWNATKALNHVSKAPGNNDVKACTGAIPKATLSMFQAFRFQKLGVANVKRQHKEAFADAIATNQQSLSVMLESQKKRSSNSSSANVLDLTGDVAASNATRLTSAIADFVYCKGLSFSSTEGEHFRQILKLSRLVTSTYIPPNRKALSNELLDVSYERRLEKYQKDLEVDAEVYGLSLFGDGATVHGMPLMNILASGVGEPSAVLAIVDCKCWCVLWSAFFLFMLLTILFNSLLLI